MLWVIAMNEELESLRLRIDGLDRELLDVLKSRLDVVAAISLVKNAHKMAALQPDRWEDVMKSRASWAHELGLPIGLAQELFEVIHKYSLKMQ